MSASGRAAGDLLALAARRGRHDDFGLTGGVYDAVGFIESVERMSGPCLALAPTAMTGIRCRVGGVGIFFAAVYQGQRHNRLRSLA
jgi:hypothetical protein